MSEQNEKGYVLHVVGPYSDEEIEVSVAQIQFWPEITEEWTDKGNMPPVRIDLKTNEYRSEFIRRLDR